MKAPRQFDQANSHLFAYKTPRPQIGLRERTIVFMTDPALTMKIDMVAYPECQPLVEQATQLIKAGKIPVISQNGLAFTVRQQLKAAKIPVISHNDLTFAVRQQAAIQEYRTRIYQLHRNPSYVVGNCLHEAAHATLMEDDGVRNIKFSGPGIMLRNGVLFPYAARIDRDLN